jgi:hypothetical protein
MIRRKMNRSSSIKYFENLKRKAKENSAQRLKNVSEEIGNDLLGKESYRKDHQDVIGWMFELYKVNPTTFYSLFKDVMPSCTNLETLRGLEEMRSFVGNFFDDSFVKLVVDDYYPNKEEKVGININPMFDWHLEWVGDDEECLSTKQLIEIMRLVYEANYKWCQKFNCLFKGDETTKLGKYNLSLLKKPKQKSSKISDRRNNDKTTDN